METRANALQDAGLTPTEPGRSLPRVGAKSAAITPNARGFGLHQLLAGRRTGGGTAPALTKKQVADRATALGLPLEPSTLTRVLKDGRTVSELNLQRIAAGLGVDLEEVRRAYTVTLREHAKAKAPPA